MTLPAWLKLESPSDLAVSNMLARHQIDIHDLREQNLSTLDLFGPDRSGDVRFGSFKATKDSILYSRLISRALIHAAPGTTVLDLGTGSGIPLIAALLQTTFTFKAIAVEPDPESARLARENIRLVGLREAVIVKVDTMQSIFKRVGEFKTPLLVTSNPPYLPWPEALTPNPQVDGGRYGIKYLETILEADFPKETTITLQWSSLTCPGRLLPKINRNYEITSLSAHEVGFGHYTSTPAVKAHLLSLRAQGEVSFNDQAGECSQIIFGAVLRRKL